MTQHKARPSPETAVAVPSERDAFEAWYGARRGTGLLGKIATGRYEWDATQDAWLAFQAGRATPPSLPAAQAVEEVEGARQVVEVYDKLHAGKLGAHWLWVVIEQIAAGVPEDEAMLSFGYYEKQDAAMAQAVEGVEAMRAKALEEAARAADSYGDEYMVQAREGDNTGASDHKACAAVEIADAIRALAGGAAK